MAPGLSRVRNRTTNQSPFTASAGPSRPPTWSGSAQNWIASLAPGGYWCSGSRTATDIAP